MTKKHIVNKFLDRLGERITVRLPDDVKKALFEFARKNDLLEFEYVNDLVIPFMRNNNGVEKLETENPSQIECPYGTWHGDHIDCAKDFDQKARIHKVSDVFCRQCWERQQKKKVEHRTTEVKAMKAQIHRHQESINQTSKQQNEVIICPKTDMVIPRTQCNNCDDAQRKRCQRVMQDSEYQRELAKVRTLID